MFYNIYIDNTEEKSFPTLDKFGYFKSGTKIGQKEVLFNRIEEKI